MPGSPDARRERSTAAASGGRADGASQKLAERLHEIAAEAPAPEDALEPALRAVLEACGATAGAICLFDQRNEMLRLAAEVGLSDEGCRQLRSVRRGGMGTWDMPLHSLLNRRAYLIESAARNRYVPPLVEPAASVRTLACVPLYAGSTPLASLILVAMIPASFSERDIRVLDQAIRELVKMIEAVRRRAPGQMSAPDPEAPDAPPPPPPAPTTTARTHTRATLSPELSPTEPSHAAPPPAAAPAPPAVTGDPATTEVLATALADSERERTRLATALEQALGRGGGIPAGTDDELARAHQALEAADAARATAAAEAEAARVEATRCRVEIQRLETSDREHIDERTRLEQALAAATARTDDDGATRTRLEAELGEARTQLARLAALEHERDALALERDRLREAAASAGEADAARAELAHARASLETLGGDTERLRAEITALSAATEAARSEQARLERELESERAQTVARQHELDTERAQAAARQQEVDAERTQAAARQQELEEALAALRAERDADAARIEALVVERDALREAAAAASEAEAAQAALASAQATIDTLHAELEQVRADVEQLSTAERELRDAQARAAQEALEARARLEQEAAEALARERSALEEQLAALRAERDDTAATLGVEREDAAREREALREELAALETRLADVTAASQVAADAAAAADAARTELASLQATVDELRSEGTQAREDLDRLATAEQALLADRARLEQALADAQEAAAQAAVTPGPVATDGDLFEGSAAAEGAVEAEAVLTMEPPPEELADVVAEAPPPAPEAPEPAAPETPVAAAADAPPRIVVLDTDAAWDGLTCQSHELTRFAPDADTVTRVVALAPQRLVVNLAVAGALELLYQLRAAGVTGRCWGMIAGPGAPKVLPLSLVDASSRPLDPDAVIATIGGYAGQGTRVVTVGADVDALISLRQALARQGLSVSMAWNAKQAEDLLAMVRPQVAVVDLDLPQRDGYGIVARLAEMAPVPTMLLVQGVEESGPRFAALLVDPAHRERMVGRDRLLATVATWVEPARKEKGAKVRQLPR